MLLPAEPPIANKISCHDVIINLKSCCGEDSASAEKALFIDAACLLIHRPNAAFQGAILSLKAPLNIPRPHGFLSRSWIGGHLNSIGWSDSPAVEKRLRAFALLLLTRSRESFSAELPGNKGDYEEHQIFGEGDSWHSRRGVRAEHRSMQRPDNPQTESGTAHGETDCRGCRRLSGKFPVHPRACAYSGFCSGQRVAEPRPSKRARHFAFRYSQATDTLTTIFVSSARSSVRWDAQRTFVSKLREEGLLRHTRVGNGVLNDLLF